LKSIYAKKLRVINAIDKRIKETLRMKPIYVNMNLSVKTVLDYIKEALDDAQAMKATKLLIYYCGHGHPDYGGWVTYPSE
jgi:translation initiation factor 2 alpha subunit (eIF-2alpha)